MFLEELHRLHIPLSDDAVFRVQKYITTDQDLKPGGPRIATRDIGRYRVCSVQVGGRRCPDFQKVPILMKKWLVDVQAWQDKISMHVPEENVRKIARLHFAYEYIHPFVDGNGRSGRALVYYMFRLARLTPFVFTSEDRFDTYYGCFEDATDMENYFLTRFRFANNSTV